MLEEKEKAAASAKETAQQNIKLPPAYQNLSPEARGKAIERISKRREDMPAVYRGCYDRAMSGNSLRAAANSFCLECVMWQREEVRLCPSYSCPLWPYRPYQLDDNDDSIDCSNLALRRADFDSESTNANERGV